MNSMHIQSVGALVPMRYEFLFTEMRNIVTHVACLGNSVEAFLLRNLTHLIQKRNGSGISN